MSDILDEGSWVFGVVVAFLLAFLLQFLSPLVWQFRESVRAYPQALGSSQISNDAASPKQQVTAEANNVTHGPGRTAIPPQGDRGDDYDASGGEQLRVTGFRILAQVFSISTTAMVFVLFVPFCIVASTLVGQFGGASTIFFRDYSSLLACCSLAWVNCEILFALGCLGAYALGGGMAATIGVTVVCGACFVVLTGCALRVLYSSHIAVASSIALFCLALSLALSASGVLGTALAYLSSPFLLYYGYMFFRGDISSLGRGLEGRQALKRSLEASTINPRDAEAHRQLGLIYQARMQYDKASERFRRAIEIDPNDSEAHLQLGRILRDEGNLPEALAHFQAAAKQDPSHNQYEVWREAASVYLGMKRQEDAKAPLEYYLSKRPYNAEGLYLYGNLLKETGQPAKAKEAYDRCVEAVNTSPRHQRRTIGKWARLAKAEIRTVGKLA